MNDGSEQGQSAIAYTGNASTMRTPTHRLILHKDGHVELHDYRTSAGETESVAARHPDLVAQLTAKLKGRLAHR